MNKGVAKGDFLSKFLVLYRSPVSAREQMANATPERLCQTAGYLGPEYDAVVPQGSLVEGALTLDRPAVGYRY